MGRATNQRAQKKQPLHEQTCALAHARVCRAREREITARARVARRDAPIALARPERQPLDSKRRSLSVAARRKQRPSRAPPLAAARRRQPSATQPPRPKSAAARRGASPTPLASVVAAAIAQCHRLDSSTPLLRNATRAQTTSKIRSPSLSDCVERPTPKKNLYESCLVCVFVVVHGVADDVDARSGAATQCQPTTKKTSTSRRSTRRTTKRSTKVRVAFFVVVVSRWCWRLDSPERARLTCVCARVWRGACVCVL